MRLRRVLYRVSWIAAFALPLWVLFGRGFFGAPLGFQFFAQLLFVPVLFVGQAVATALVTLRGTNRRTRSVSWSDSGLLAVAWIGQLAAGFFLVDSAAGRTAASAFTVFAGAGASPLSSVLAAAAIMLTVVALAVLIAVSVRRSVRALRQGFVSTTAALDPDRTVTVGPHS
ncbi:hypothetical protein EDF46_0791 [Frondihabitans sp. PhB188]|uniref:hypothetical protein n=1 Tax=Frondihabitans sp. PhB188 TaxID=2485200 RepID=UPI000FBA13BF|nr:hypothetical protein [Frondihabitans sp. PhB188]ROQ41413.1 hypothetical protein EDF46_0791 [Frondihabitans sp. PhB188]